MIFFLISLLFAQAQEPIDTIVLKPLTEQEQKSLEDYVKIQDKTEVWGWLEKLTDARMKHALKYLHVVNGDAYDGVVSDTVPTKEKLQAQLEFVLALDRFWDPAAYPAMNQSLAEIMKKGEDPDFKVTLAFCPHGLSTIPVQSLPIKIERKFNQVLRFRKALAGYRGLIPVPGNSIEWAKATVHISTWEGDIAAQKLKQPSGEKVLKVMELEPQSLLVVVHVTAEDDIRISVLNKKTQKEISSWIEKKKENREMPLIQEIGIHSSKTVLIYNTFPEGIVAVNIASGKEMFRRPFVARLLSRAHSNAEGSILYTIYSEDDGRIVVNLYKHDQPDQALRVEGPSSVYATKNDATYSPKQNMIFAVRNNTLYIWTNPEDSVSQPLEVLKNSVLGFVLTEDELSLNIITNEGKPFILDLREAINPQKLYRIYLDEINVPLSEKPAAPTPELPATKGDQGMAPRLTPILGETEQVCRAQPSWMELLLPKLGDAARERGL